MAYKIGTTTVINDSLQLQNIGSLDATTTSTIGNAMGVASYSLGAQYASSANAITVPSGKTKMAAFGVGGGGGGAQFRSGGTGGWGGHSFSINFPVTGGTTTFNVAIGGGGGVQGNGGATSVSITNGNTHTLAVASGGTYGFGQSFGDSYASNNGTSGGGRMGFGGTAQDAYQAGTSAVGPTVYGTQNVGDANSAMQGFIPIAAANSGYQQYLEATGIKPAGAGGASAWSTGSSYRPGAAGTHGGPISDNNIYNQSTGGQAGTVWTFFA